MNWSKRYKAMKKGLGLNNKRVAEITGNTEGGIKRVTGPSGTFPRWAKLAVWVYEHFTNGDN